MDCFTRYFYKPIGLFYLRNNNANNNANNNGNNNANNNANNNVNNNAGNQQGGGVFNPGGNGNADPGKTVTQSGNDNTGPTHPGFGSSYTYTVNNKVIDLYVSTQTGEFTSFSGTGTKTTDQFESGKCDILVDGPIKYTLNPNEMSIGPSQTITWTGKVMVDLAAAPPPGFTSPGAITGNWEVKYKRGGQYDPVKGQWVVEGYMTSNSGNVRLDFVVTSVNVVISDTVGCSGEPFDVHGEGFTPGGAYKWFSNDPNVSIMSFNGGTCTVELLNDAKQGSISCKYTVGGVSYTRSATLLTMNGPADFTLPDCAPDGTVTRPIVSFQGPTPNTTTVTPQVLNVPAGTGSGMVTVTACACGTCISHDILVSKLPDFTLPCAVKSGTPTASVIKFNGPLPNEAVISPSILNAGTNPIVEVTVSCCGVSFKHSVAVLPDFTVPCCASDGAATDKTIKFLGAIPPGVTITPATLTTKQKDDTVGITVSLCNVSYRHTITVVNSSVTSMAGPNQSLDLKKYVDMINKALAAGAKVADAGVKAATKVGPCEQKSDKFVTGASALPKVTVKSTSFELCCPNNKGCVKDALQVQLDVKFQLIKLTCYIPTPICGIPFQVVLGAEANVTMSGGFKETCNPDPQWCVGGKIEGNISGGVGLGMGTVNWANLVLKVSASGSVNVCFNPSCWGGEFQLGKGDLEGTINLTSFYSISGTWNLWGSLPPWKFGSKCP